MTNPSKINVPTKNLIRNILLDNKDEVFFKEELKEKIKKEFGKTVKLQNLRYHASKLVEQNKEIKKFKINQNKGCVWGYKDSIEEVKQRFEL